MNIDLSPAGKTYLVRRLPGSKAQSVAASLADAEVAGISTINWKEFSHAPRVSFQAGYDQRQLHLRYTVTANAVLAKYAYENEPVYQDDCVEFFMATEHGEYINFEFNCIGTILAQRGRSRQDRIFLTIDELAQVKILSSLPKEPINPERQGPISWNLNISIPLFLLRIAKDPAGRQFRANFYKCGDDMSQVHYLSWNPIATPAPDFHRPEFFGTLIFE